MLSLCLHAVAMPMYDGISLFFIQILPQHVHILHSLDLFSAVAHVSLPPQILGRTNIIKVDSMLKHLRPALLMLLFLSLITGVLYPLVVTGISQAIFPSKANGSIIEKNGQPVGSSLIGQQFTSPKYFWSRLSATSPFPYNASNSSGSNYGPLNPALVKAAKDRIDQLHPADPANQNPIPVDLVTASGSGLDPHISIAAAFYQLPRVARERNISEETLRQLIDQYTDARDFGFLGEPGVNVLRLNLALDDRSPLKGGL
jgi:K+-transporting ATPase KdpC subunit